MFNWSIDIKPWKRDLKSWDSLTKKAENLFIDILKSDLDFEKYYSIFLKWPSNKIVEETLNKENKSLIPFIFIANSDTTFYENYISDNILNIIIENFESVSNTYKSMFQETLINHINGKTTDNRISQVSRVLKSIPSNNLVADNIKKTGLFDDNGYENLLRYCIENNVSENQLGANLGIKINTHQELYRALEVDLFLEKLKSINYSRPSKLIKHILNNDLFNKELDGGLLLGHEIIKSIIKYSKSVDVHSEWIDLIIGIASDPRSSKLSENYIKWWSLIDEKLIKRFIQILSHADILLFLDAFEEFAKDNDDTMERMFKSRKQFLVGLSIQNLIDESRLFLPEEVREFIELKRPNLDTSFIAETFGHGTTCIIYMRVGPFHIIEGSHNCKIWLYDRNPFTTNIFNEQNLSMHYKSLTTSLAEKYYERTLDYPLDKIHNIYGRWKIDVLVQMRNKLSIKAEQLMLKEEISNYRDILSIWRMR